MRQQPYFIKPANHLSYRNQSSKQSFSQQQNDESKSKSQNRLLSNIKKPNTLVTQALVSPQLQRVNNKLKILKSNNRIDLPQIPSPKQMQQCDQSLSKFKSFENLNIQMRVPTPRRFKSDEQNVSDLGVQQKKTIRFSQHVSNIKLRNESSKLRNRSNHTPFLKTNTEPSEIVHSPILQQPKSNFDDSREILYQLQRGYTKERQSVFKTEPDDPYRMGSLCEARNSSVKKQSAKLILNESQKFPTKHYIEIPCDDEYSQFFKEDDNQNNFKNTQKNNLHQQQISQQTKEKILDLLFLSTGELKKKFNEQSRIQQSKITNRAIQNKPVVSKSRFPNDFFNVLHTNDSQII